AVGVLAAGGPGLAIIGSDGIIERCDDVPATLALLASRATVGEAVVALNERYRGPNRPRPYWLIGDPDLALCPWWLAPPRTAHHGELTTSPGVRRNWAHGVSSPGAETLWARMAGWEDPLHHAARTLAPIAQALTRTQLDGHPPGERLWRRWVRAHALAV